MTPEVVGVAGILALFALLLAGVPIAAALGLVGIGGLALLVGPEPALIKAGIVAFDVASKYQLGVLPLFLLMAHFCFTAGASRDFFAAAASFIGHRRGGLALASIGGCAAFGAVSGSSLATASTMGLIALPEMRRAGYAPTLATGALAAGGSIGTLTPPSAVLIVFGILSEQSIGRLFTAAIVPAITQALLYMAVVALLCRMNPALAPATPRVPWRDRLRALLRIADIGALVLIVIGGIASGIFSPSEAASIGVLGSMLLCWKRGKLSLATVKESVRGALRTAGMIYLIIMMAILLSVFVSVSGFAQHVVAVVDLLHGNALLTTLLVVLLLIVLGTFLDGMAMLTLVVPIFLPVFGKLGLDPIWFGILVVRTMEMGLVTPPVGMNVYVIHSYAKDLPLTTVFRGVVPFYVADLIHIGLLIALPQLALFLPRLLGT